MFPWLAADDLQRGADRAGGLEGDPDLGVVAAEVVARFFSQLDQLADRHSGSLPLFFLPGRVELRAALKTTLGRQERAAVRDELRQGTARLAYL